MSSRPAALFIPGARSSKDSVRGSLETHTGMPNVYHCAQELLGVVHGRAVGGTHSAVYASERYHGRRTLIRTWLLCNRREDELSEDTFFKLSARLRNPAVQNAIQSLLRAIVRGLHTHVLGAPAVIEAHEALLVVKCFSELEALLGKEPFAAFLGREASSEFTGDGVGRWWVALINVSPQALEEAKKGITRDPS